MNSESAIPASVRQWVSGYVSGPLHAEDTSWPRPESRVWRVSTDSDLVYLKMSPDERAYQRELHAYTEVVPALDPATTPHLLGADPDLRTILTTALPGVIVRTTPMSTTDERRAHHLAGTFLAHWHHHRPPGDDKSARDELADSVRGRVDRALNHRQGHPDAVTDQDAQRVDEACHQLPQLAALLPLSYRHGDFSPRNWLWNPPTRTLAVLDYEQAQTGPVVDDLVWLAATTWPTRPDLKAAFLAGYGRDLDQNEHQALLMLVALTALSYLDAARNRRDPDLLNKAATAFANLDLAHRTATRA